MVKKEEKKLEKEDKDNKKPKVTLIKKNKNVKKGSAKPKDKEAKKGAKKVKTGNKEIIKDDKKEVVKKEDTRFQGKYFYAVGRRKKAVAQVRIYPSRKSTERDILVNTKKFRTYLPTSSLQNTILSAFKKAGCQNQFEVTIVVRGGGKNAQAEAICLGIARALIKYDENLRPALKAAGFLKRDARKVERKKPGLKKARRAPQWQKR